MSVLAQIPADTFEAGTRIGNKRVRVPPRVTLGELTVNNIGVLKKLNSVLFPVAYSDKFYRDVLDVEITPEEVTKLIFYQDLPVGNIVCRLEPASALLPTTISTSTSPIIPPVASSSTAPAKPAPKIPSEPHKLYIMTLGVLAPYRRQGLASKLVKHVIAQAEASHRPPVVEEFKIKAPTSDEPVDKKKKVDPKKDDKVVARPEPKKIVSLYLHVQVSNDEARKFWEGHGFKVTGTVPNYYRKIEPRDAWLLERAIEVEA